MTLPDKRIDNRYYSMASDLSVNDTDMQEAQIRALDEQYTLLKRQILQFQSVTLGLFPRFGYINGQGKVAHVRDSIYCAAASWALSQAYRRCDDDQGRTQELSQSAVKCMRGILYCWTRQADKVEKFKENQSADHALHSVFDALTGDTIYKDDEYEHLQIDVVALYLIFLVQMIKSGLQIIFTTDEVNFVQNLVFYVERAYRTPDFGMWERGTKYNNGCTEIHASSIGMVKAALESVNGVNLFGDQGASWSVIFVDIDAHNRNRTIFESILPRESNSKNTDASLLPTVSWPAFAVHEEPQRSRTISKITRKLEGSKGIKRYFRDGYKTVLEDKNRKYYKPAEIKMFDGIECEWPMFYVYLLLDSIFLRDKEGIEKYSKKVEALMTKTNDGLLLPQYFFIPSDQIAQERANPGSTERLPSDAGTTNGVFMWGQSIYFISQLLVSGLLNINELDPIRRHLSASERPKVNSRYSSFQITPPDLVLQVVLMAESSRLQQLLATYGIQTQTPHQIEPIQIWSSKELSKSYEYLGVNKKLNLTGRPKRPFGVLSTSKPLFFPACIELTLLERDPYASIGNNADQDRDLIRRHFRVWSIYRACGATVLCYPLLFDVTDFYMAQDVSIIIDDLKNDLAFLSKCWKLAGRPTFCMLIRENNIRGNNFSEFLDFLAQFKRGNVDGIRVRVGKLQTIISSACIEHLDFLHTLPDGGVFEAFEEVNIGHSKSFKSLRDVPVLDCKDETSLDEQELKHKATWDLVNMLKNTESLTAQSQLLKTLFHREGGAFYVEGVQVSQRMEKLIGQAGIHKQWHIVRQCSALLEKAVDSLAPSITSILVRGKHLTVGVFGHEEQVLDKPISPNDIKAILYNNCVPHDPCQAVLQQELILAIGKLIATAPDHFDGILKIRIGWFVRAMEMEQEQQEELTTIAALSPYHVKQLLHSVLVIHGEEDNRTPLHRRQIDGALSRVPKDFYERVWKILERTPGGIKVAGYTLPQQPTLSDMTMQELNFSLLVEQMLSKIVDPAYRQLMVEAFMVVSTILDRNPELIFHQAVNMDKTIQDAYDEFQKDLNRLEGREKQDDMQHFYNTHPNVKHGTTSYIAKAIVRNLLDGDLKMMVDDMCCVM